jgi:hypothetical protein
MTSIHARALLGLAVVVLCSAGQGGCDDRASASAADTEKSLTDRAMVQMLRNQPVPVFDYSMERRMFIEIYKARQRAVATFSVVQSAYTGKVLWSCPSIGFPLPYAVQLTNPHQSEWRGYGDHYSSAVIEQAEPNGLYSPSQSDATWVPCVNANGNITPVYEEKHVTVFFQPMVERNGTLVPAEDAKPSFEVKP